MRSSASRARRSDRSSGPPQPPRVLFVSSHAQRAGSERVLEELLDVLPAEVVVGVVALQQGPLVERLERRGVRVTVLETGPGPAAALRSARHLRRRVRQDRPDVVHANGVKAAVVAVLLGRRPPVVWMKHDVSLDGVLGRGVARRCAAVACVSEQVRRGIDGAPGLLVVPPGVRVDAEESARSGAALRRELGVQGPVVTVLGRLDPAKGHGELVEVLPRVRQAVPDAHLLLVGPDVREHPGQRQRLHERVSQLGLAGAVTVLDHRPSAAVLGASDVVCIATVPRPDGSGREGYGLVTAEALSLGLPVVGYDVGATAEVLGPCGTLVPSGDREGLADQVVRVLQDPAVRDRESRCGASRREELSVDRVAERMLALYAKVAA